MAMSDLVHARQQKASALAGALTAAVARADENAARSRAIALREADPSAGAQVLAERLIRTRCRQAAAIGAVTSAAALMPGVGTLASMTVGVAADVTATLKLQAEMVLELAALYGVPLGEIDRKRVLFLVAGIGTGTAAVVGKTGRSLARAAGERLAGRWLTHALPLVGVAASAGTNAASTYMIGRSASLYFHRTAIAAPT